MKQIPIQFYCNSQYLLMGNQPIYKDQGVFDNDDLYQVSPQQMRRLPHSFIGALTFFNKQSGRGTGFLISKDLVLTAAHNIYNKPLKSNNTDFRFYLGADRIALQYFEIEDWRYPEQFKTKAAGRLQYDYALLKLKQSVQSDQLLNLSLPCQICLKRANKITSLEIFGYPGVRYGAIHNYRPLDKNGDSFEIHQYGLARRNKITVLQASNCKIGYRISTLPGQSGSPILSNQMVIGLHNGEGVNGIGYNIGRLITPDMILKLKKWQKQMNGDQMQINVENSCEHMKNQASQFSQSSIISAEKLSQILQHLRHLYQTTPSQLDSIGNYQFKSIKHAKTQQRGGFPYYKPVIGTKIGIKIANLYYSGDNSWLKENGDRRQWAVAFFGVVRPTRYDKLRSMMNGRQQGTMIRPGVSQPYREEICLATGETVGDGIYVTPYFVECLLNYSQIDPTERYHVILQCRVRPSSIRITSKPQYWVINNSRDVRPYAFLLFTDEDIQRLNPQGLDATSLHRKLYREEFTAETWRDKYSQRYQVFKNLQI